MYVSIYLPDAVNSAMDKARDTMSRSLFIRRAILAYMQTHDYSEEKMTGMSPLGRSDSFSAMDKEEFESP